MTNEINAAVKVRSITEITTTETLSNKNDDSGMKMSLATNVQGKTLNKKWNLSSHNTMKQKDVWLIEFIKTKISILSDYQSTIF